MATPDGMPLAWLIRRRSGARQERINGPDLTLKLCAEAEMRGIGVAFFGSSERTLAFLKARLGHRFPNLRITDMISPPFRDLSREEDGQLVARLNAGEPGIVFVGLGCPKQEVWMHSHRDQVNGVMIGVGAAFDYIAETIRRPPVWMQRAGLEWLGRLMAEPRRLWQRYFVTNTQFLAYAIRELILPRRRSQIHKDRPNG